MSVTAEQVEAAVHSVRDVGEVIRQAKQRLQAHQVAFEQIVKLTDQPNCLADALDSIRQIASQYARTA